MMLFGRQRCACRVMIRRTRERSLPFVRSEKRRYNLFVRKVTLFTLSLAAGCVCICGGSKKAARECTAREALAAKEDAHGLTNDDYLLLDGPYVAGSGWTYASVARMLTPASSETKQLAQFESVSRRNVGVRLWTS